MLKNIFHLHKPSNDPVEIKDIGSSDEEKDRTQSVTMDVDDYEDLMKKDDKETEEEAEDDPVTIAAQVMASLPHSPPKMATSSELQSSSVSVIIATNDTLSVGSLPATSQLLATNMEVSTTSSTELQISSSTIATSTASTSTIFPVATSACTVRLPFSSVSSTSSVLSAMPTRTSIVDTSVCVAPPIITLVIATTILDTSVNTPPNVATQVSSASATTSTIVSIPSPKATVSKTPQKLMITGNVIDEDINLVEEIIIPKLYFNIATIEEMRLVSKLLEQKAKQKQLRTKRDRELSIIQNAKDIISEAIGIETDSSQHILLQLEEAVNKFLQDNSAEEKLMNRATKKFENKVLEHIVQQIAIN